MNQSDPFSKKIIARSLRKNIGITLKKRFAEDSKKKRDLNPVTVVPVILTDENAYTPVVVCPGPFSHYRRIHGTLESPHTALVSCFLFHYAKLGVDFEIISSLVEELVEKTCSLDQKFQCLLLILDGYSSGL